MSAWDRLIVKFWACVAPPEMAVVSYLVQIMVFPTPYVRLQWVKDLYMLYAPLQANETRWNWFLANWRVVTGTVVEDEEPIEVIFLVNLWLLYLKGAVDAGEVPLLPTERCLQLNFYNQPT